MSNKNTSGQCLCGAISIELQGLPDKVEACHCDTCRRWGSGPLFTLTCKEGIAWSGEQHIREYNSSDWAARAFCDSCGSHLYYFLKPTGQYMISPGLFEGTNSLQLDMEVFIDEKPPYYCLSEDSRKLTGEEVMKLFADAESGD